MNTYEVDVTFTILANSEEEATKNIEIMLDDEGYVAEVHSAIEVKE